MPGRAAGPAWPGGPVPARQETPRVSAPGVDRQHLVTCAAIHITVAPNGPPLVKFAVAYIVVNRVAADLVSNEHFAPRMARR